MKELVGAIFLPSLQTQSHLWEMVLRRYLLPKLLAMQPTISSPGTLAQSKAAGFSPGFSTNFVNASALQKIQSRTSSSEQIC